MMSEHLRDAARRRLCARSIMLVSGVLMAVVTAAVPVPAAAGPTWTPRQPVALSEQSPDRYTDFATWPRGVAMSPGGTTLGLLSHGTLVPYPGGSWQYQSLFVGATT